MPYRLDPHRAASLIEDSGAGMALRTVLGEFPLRVSDEQFRDLPRSCRMLFTAEPPQTAEPELAARERYHQVGITDRDAVSRWVAVDDFRVVPEGTEPRNSVGLTNVRARPRRGSHSVILDESSSLNSTSGGPRSNVGDIEPEDL